MNMEDACNLALERLKLDEVPPYSSNLLQVQKKRREFLDMVGQILRDDSVKKERTVKATVKLKDFI